MRALPLAVCAALVAAVTVGARAQVSPPLPTSQERPAGPGETPTPTPAPMTRDEATALAARAADRIKALRPGIARVSEANRS